MSIVTSASIAPHLDRDFHISALTSWPPYRSARFHASYRFDNATAHSAVGEEMARGQGRNGHRVLAADPAMPFAAHQFEVGLVDQVRRLKRLIRLMSEMVRGHCPQFIRHKRQKPLAADRSPPPYARVTIVNIQWHAFVGFRKRRLRVCPAMAALLV